MTFFFANIKFFYWGVGLITVIICAKIRTNAAVGSALTVFALILPSSLSTIWASPGSMGVWHVVTVVCMCLFFYGQTGLILICLTFSMVLIDIVYMAAPEQPMSSSFPLGLFWWQSILNLLYLVQCAVILRRCYTSCRKEKGRRKPRNLKNDSIYADEGDCLPSKGAMG